MIARRKWRMTIWRLAWRERGREKSWLAEGELNVAAPDCAKAIDGVTLLVIGRPASGQLGLHRPRQLRQRVERHRLDQLGQRAEVAVCRVRRYAHAPRSLA